MPPPYLGEPYDVDYYLGGVEPNSMTEAGYDDYRTKEPYIRNIAGDIEAELGPVSGLKVLDVGCAFGFLTDELASRGAIVTGVDISAFAIGEAVLRFPTRTFLNLDAQALTGITPNSFNLAVIAGVLECMPDDAQLDLLANELKRVVKNNGDFYVLSYEDRTPPVQYNQRTQAEWITIIEASFPGRTVVVSDVGHLPIFYQYRIVVT